MKLTIEKARDEATKMEIQSRWTSCQNDLNQLIEGWIIDGRSMLITPGYDDMDPFILRIYFIFQQDKEDIAEAFILQAEVLERLPELQRYIPSLIPDTKMIDYPKSDEDEEFFESRDESLGAKWDDDFCERIFSLQSAVTVALAYGLTPQAEVVFSTPNKYFFEEIETPAYQTDQLLSVTALQTNPNTGLTRHENFYALRR